MNNYWLGLFTGAIIGGGLLWCFLGFMTWNEYRVDLHKKFDEAPMNWRMILGMRPYERWLDNRRTERLNSRAGK